MKQDYIKIDREISHYTLMLMQTSHEFHITRSLIVNKLEMLMKDRNQLYKPDGVELHCMDMNYSQQTRRFSVQGGEGQSNIDTPIKYLEGKQGSGTHKTEITSPVDIKCLDKPKFKIPIIEGRGLPPRDKRLAEIKDGWSFKGEI